mgnify:CR=1 FL=1
MIHAIGGIDDKFIDEAAQPARKKAVIIRWCAAAAGFCVIAGLTAAVWINSGTNGIFLNKNSGAANGTGEEILTEEYDGDYKANGTADTVWTDFAARSRCRAIARPSWKKQAARLPTPLQNRILTRYPAGRI